jgi:hypothetical protein
MGEFPGGRGIFQPEIKKVDDLWFASTGGKWRPDAEALVSENRICFHVGVLLVNRPNQFSEAQ